MLSQLLVCINATFIFKNKNSAKFFLLIIELLSWGLYLAVQMVKHRGMHVISRFITKTERSAECNQLAATCLAECVHFCPSSSFYEVEIVAIMLYRW